MKYSRLALLLAAFSLSACGDSASSAANNGTANNGTAVNNGSGLDGEALYVQHCQACHGVEGVGTAIWEPVIAGYQPVYDIVKNGQGTGMPPIAVTDAENRAIQLYLLSIGPDLSSLTGGQIYENLCASCHGNVGQGVEGKGFPISFVHPEYGKFITRNGRDGLGFDGAMPMYPETVINEQQMDEIIAFLHSGARPEGGENLYVALCSNCHAVDGTGGFSEKPVAGHGEIDEVVRKGKGTDPLARIFYMPAWDTELLQTFEMEQVSAYLDSLPEP